MARRVQTVIIDSGSEFATLSEFEAEGVGIYFFLSEMGLSQKGVLSAGRLLSIYKRVFLTKYAVTATVILSINTFK